mgnify:CR=1 FL=1
MLGMTEPAATGALPRSPLTVAAAQAEAVPGDIPRNAAVAADLVARAADEGAALVVLPELFLPAYHPPTLAAEPARCDVTADETGQVTDPRLDPLRTAAQTHRAVIVVSASVRQGPRRTLSALVIEPDEEVRVGYDKQNLCGPHERDLFSPGRRPGRLTVAGWRWGLGICYDGCFPEHARAAALDGCHGMLYPAAYLIGAEHRRDLYYAARALDNTSYVVVADAVGGPAPWRFSGGSAIYDPEGRALERAPNTGTAVVVTTLDPVELARVRHEHTMLADLEYGSERGRDHQLA